MITMKHPREGWLEDNVGSGSDGKINGGRFGWAEKIGKRVVIESGVGFVVIERL